MLLLTRGCYGEYTVLGVIDAALGAVLIPVKTHQPTFSDQPAFTVPPSRSEGTIYLRALLCLNSGQRITHKNTPAVYNNHNKENIQGQLERRSLNKYLDYFHNEDSLNTPPQPRHDLVGGIHGIKSHSLAYYKKR